MGNMKSQFLMRIMVYFRSAPNGRVVHAAAVKTSTSQLEGLDMGADNDIPSKGEDSAQLPSAVPFDCTCGMPLCICEAPSSSEVKIHPTVMK